MNLASYTERMKKKYIWPDSDQMLLVSPYTVGFCSMSLPLMSVGALCRTARRTPASIHEGENCHYDKLFGSAVEGTLV